MDILKNDLVRLRAVEPSDADIIYAIEINDIGNTDSCWLAPISYDSVLTYALNYDANPFSSNGLRLVVERITDKSVVGLIDLYDLDKFNSRAFVSIYIIEKYRRNKYAFNAVKILCRYASNVLGLHQLAAKILDGNCKSQNLFAGCGFEKIAKLNDWLYDAANKKYSNMLIYQKIF